MRIVQFYGKKTFSIRRIFLEKSIHFYPIQQDVKRCFNTIQKFKFSKKFLCMLTRLKTISDFKAFLCVLESKALHLFISKFFNKIYSKWKILLMKLPQFIDCLQIKSMRRVHIIIYVHSILFFLEHTGNLGQARVG